jgi:hypothetical protein
MMKTVNSAKGHGPVANLSLTGAGLSMVDGMLEVLSRRQQRAGINAALDLRSELALGVKADAILEAFFAFRAALDDDLFPRFHRLQDWLEAEIVSWASAGEFDPPRQTRLDLNAADYAELCASCREEATGSGTDLEDVQIRFVYLPQADLRRLTFARF